MKVRINEKNFIPDSSERKPETTKKELWLHYKEHLDTNVRKRTIVYSDLTYNPFREGNT